MSQSFSAEKSVYMLFGKNGKHEVNLIQWKDSQPLGEIERVNKHKVLGLIIQENIEWNEHIDAIVKKLGSYSYAINRLRHLLNRADLIKLYYAFIYSTIRYGIMFWGNSKGVDRVFKLQKRTHLEAGTEAGLGAVVARRLRGVSGVMEAGEGAEGARAAGALASGSTSPKDGASSPPMTAAATSSFTK
ncbi:unnamed protein product [Bemisia tabaci]|uniref:Uncharacterized protein n=1 Tax=Bemisia tabaci TaxID=7038 RepID=A0A9P0ANX9_BEMTA|nr:unnamed protein product [Bemisia tabaci]